MAIATFIKRTEKTALLSILPNEFVFSGNLAYVPSAAIPMDTKVGDKIEIPDGFEFVPMVGKDGETFTSEKGDVLHMLKY